MGSDPAETIGTLPARARSSARHRRRNSHRSLKYRPAVRRVQRTLLLLLLGIGVVLASLYFAQRFSAYEPPPSVSD